jgi:N-glycosylase/DNA lyase
MNYEEVRHHYREHRGEIEKKLEEFEEVGESSDYRLFIELVFVILTSQTEAEKAWEAAKELDDRNLLLEGNKQQIAKILERNGVQYEENKASYIVENRELLSQPTLHNPTNELKLKEKLDCPNLDKTRGWLVDNVKGLGWKGASHFLRNIGHGDGLAIISSHIINQMNELDVIESAVAPSNKEEYLDMEEKLKEFSDDVGIDIRALDLVLWSMKTGEVFK